MPLWKYESCVHFSQLTKQFQSWLLSLVIHTLEAQANGPTPTQIPESSRCHLQAAPCALGAHQQLSRHPPSAALLLQLPAPTTTCPAEWDMLCPVNGGWWLVLRCSDVVTARPPLKPCGQQRDERPSSLTEGGLLWLTGRHGTGCLVKALLEIVRRNHVQKAWYM